MRRSVLRFVDIEQQQGDCVVKNTVRRFWLAALFATSAIDVHAALFDVDALVNSSAGSGVGLDTGITLSAGQVFTVTVDPDDSWSAGALPRWSNADGLTGPRLATGTDETLLPFGTPIGADFGLLSQAGLSAPFGTLVGELSGTFFKLGTSFSGAAPAAGTLKLYYWDSNNADNTGSVQADVRTIPEPGTYALLTLGLAAVAFSSRSRKPSA
jgi:PEP-CTERM motif